MTIVLRLAANAIAIAAVIDPGVVREVAPPARLGVRIAAADPIAAQAVFARLEDRLDGQAILVREVAAHDGPWCVGVDLCVAAVDGTTALTGRPGRAVHLLHVPGPPDLRIVAARSDRGHRHELQEARVAVTGGQPGDSVTLVVEDQGVEVGRVSHRRTAPTVDADIAVPWWPRGDGARLLTVRIAGSARGDTVLAETVATPLDVLLWEGRPSWTGTFIRRALETDARFAVRSLNQLSPRRLARRGVSGRPADDDLQRARAIVVSGADGLGTAEIARLERRARGGGAIVVALDDAPSPALRTLMPGPIEARRRALDPVALDGPLRSAELVTFRRGPGDVVLAAWPAAPDGPQPVVVERATGRGTIVVSGALDAWRWRAADGFDRFWLDTVMRAASATSPTVDARWVPGPTGPRLLVTSAEGAATGRWPAARIAITCAGTAARSHPLVPQAQPGTWLATTRPDDAGCTVQATAQSASHEVQWPGAPSLPAEPPAPGALETLAAATGGTRLALGDAEEAIAALVAAAPLRPLVPVRWHPMRAPWWFVPFVGLLGAEWWLRRRSNRV